ncbi:hypothetical protein [Variovorax sp. PAMC26660]|uniref:hypothetical protein n=1 Tax=Variovorax sp. PAMC26660 TaxID=2762322 RepID=UPI00164E779C|nr:hypothetical protein [Variovorax sp. PAMC26660]QNK67824.1 hypothetical protein H7F35_32660 [Variovorax sp. PAMC26660]
MYAYVATAIAALLIGFAGGWKTQAWRFDAAELERARVEARDQFKKIERGDVAAANHEAFKAEEQVRYVYRTQQVDRIVERPVYRDACFDDDGLRVLNDAIAGRAPAGEPATTLPGPGAGAR